MKNYLKIWIILFSSIFIFTACEDNDSILEQESSVEKNIELVSSGTNKSSASNSLLQFSSMEIFKETLNELELQYENHDDIFLEKWGYLDNDKLDEKEDELGYTPQQPFIDFEKQFKGFKSLRKEIAEKEKIWLKNEILDEKNDPYDHFVFEEEARTVLNTKGQVKIGKDLYQMTMFGYIKITNGDFDALNLVYNNDVRGLDLPNVVIVGSYDGTVDNSNTQSVTTTDGTSSNTTTLGARPPGDTSCRTSFNATQYYYPAYKRKIKGYQKIDEYSFWHGTSIMAKTRHFKKRRRGWRCRRGWIGVRIQGQNTLSRPDINDLCYAAQSNNINKYKRRRYVKIIRSIPSNANEYFGTFQHQLKTKHRRYSSEYTKYFWN